MYERAGVVAQLGDVAADQARLTFLQQQLHAIALAIGQARARADSVDLGNLQKLFADVKAQADTLVAQLYHQEMPSATEQAIARVSDAIQADASAALGAAGKAVSLVGSNILWPLAIVAGVVGAIIYLPRPRRQAAAA